MKTAIVLAMHGAPPNDFPPQEVVELLNLHKRIEHSSGSERAAMEERHTKLDAKIRAWPRTPANDPFHVGSLALAEQLQSASGLPVILGFNEFCTPSLDQALDQAVASGVTQVLVITPMMTRGGEHSEHDIPDAIRRAQERHTSISICYIWPFKIEVVARFLAEQIQPF